ncbi:MAG: hypothetical protein N2440_04695 [Actinobacteria bacterium]|nr:hypothetical protein [Actinomycetota bacterium]
MDMLSELDTIVQNPPCLSFCLTKHFSLKSPMEIKTRLRELFNRFCFDKSDEILEDISSVIYSSGKNSIYCILNSEGKVFLKENNASFQEFELIDNFPKLVQLYEYNFWYEDYLLCVIERKLSEIFAVRDGDLELLNLIKEDVPNKVKYGGLLGFEENRIRRHVEHHEIQYLKNLASLVEDIAASKKINKVVLGVREDFKEEVESVFDDRNRYIFAEVRLEDDFQKKISSSMEALLKNAYSLAQKRVGDLNLKPVKIEEVINSSSYDYLTEIFVPKGFEIDGYYCKNDLEISFLEGNCPLCSSSMLKTANLIDVLLYKLSMKKTKINFLDENKDLFFTLR